MKLAFGRIFSFLAPVVVALAVFVAVTQMRQPPEQVGATERARAVRVMTVEAQDFTPRIVGYGTVKPPRTWDAVAQVAGRVDFVHPDLRKGALLPAQTEIIRISPKDYELEVKTAEANLASARTRLSELEVQRENAKRSLAIEERALELLRKDIERKRDLVARATVSPSTVEEAERGFLAQQTKVQELKNTIGLSPVQIAAQRTQIDVNEAQLAVARLNLERTRIALPFMARVASVDVEQTQFVGVGSVLAAADDIGAAEVTAQMPLAQFASFVRLSAPDGARFDIARAPEGPSMLEQAGWSATVRIGGVGRGVEWPARIVRTSDTIDPSSRTVGAIVSVDAPYRDLIPGERPPLVKGMFVEVELRGAPLSDQIVAPRSAVHDGRVFIADAENRLRIRPVEIRAIQDDLALIADGLAPEERIVLSDLSPAIEGMLLIPIEAAEAER